MSVEPYRELLFDEEGDGPAGQAGALAALARQGVGDLVVFAHGWNSSPSGATRLCSDFFAPFPELLAPGVEAGYAGLIWPSMVFSGEPGPDYRALATVLPEKEPVLALLTELLVAAAPEEAAFARFGALLRKLADLPPEGPAGPGERVPEFLTADPVEMCARFTSALDAVGTGATPEVPGLGRYWRGAREALRQTSYHVLRQRARLVGESGLGPLLGEVARAAPGLRVHLVGHGMGARLVAYALKGLPPGVRPVASVTLLQGAFSPYVFAARLPHDPGRSGALTDVLRRVRGPVVACYSRHDTELGVLYPLASRLVGDSASGPSGGAGTRWEAMGHAGVLAVPGTATVPLGRVLREGVPGAGCVSVDVSEAVRSHGDIRRAELARVVVAASGTGR
ncbi:MULTISPECIES: serine-threonine protein kinase [unclassified Streptomyces]|uniref:serine-threonine protein kinase n=1 Tax=unclassified Streptomyces TaxID=2593676 RepID=UPI0016605805|nr:MULTISPECIES: serine-threonine protein kinase [unclassified Streptomyces]MBD0712179.1 serine-threonine protein kinase [Streptomyces sp. CBMA291]MBD0714011.1 serine-threonine protein kinase [Streptomyces sp. CBMA370]